jgi:hypothetical protein
MAHLRWGRGGCHKSAHTHTHTKYCTWGELAVVGQFIYALHQYWDDDIIVGHHTGVDKHENIISKSQSIE